MFSSIYIVLFVMNLHSGIAVYFSMRNVHLTLPSNFRQFPFNNYSITTFKAHSQFPVHYTVVNSKDFYIDSTTGEITLSSHNTKNENGMPQTSANISVIDNYGHQDFTRLDIIWKDSVAPVNCQTLLEDVCFWQSVDYQIAESGYDMTHLIGTIGPRFLYEMCTNSGLSISYFSKSLQKIQLTRTEDMNEDWILSTKPGTILDRENDTSPIPFEIICTIRSHQNIIHQSTKIIEIYLSDIDDNIPIPQEDSINILLASNVIFEGQIVEHPDLIFHDKDSPSANDFEAQLLGDYLSILDVNCVKFENDFHSKMLTTALYCKLIFKKTMQIPESIYAIELNVEDINLKNSTKQAQMAINIYFSSHDYPLTLPIKQIAQPLRLYLTREIKVFRTAGPLARITQPPIHLLNEATNFTLIHSNYKKLQLFGVTINDGIIYVNNFTALRHAIEFIAINITWYRGEILEFDELFIRIVDEPNKTCDTMSSHIWEWPSCAEFSRSNICENTKSCGVSTGGTFSLTTRSVPKRCTWRGDKFPGNVTTHLYSTCTPDLATCPDGICDELERLYYKICPQDCTETVHFPTRINPQTGRGIDRATGICFCDETGSCHCTIPKKKKSKIATDSTNSLFVTSYSNLTNADNLHNSQNQDPMTCGVVCISLVAGVVLVIVLMLVLLLIWWRLDHVHKTVKNRLHCEAEDALQMVNASLSQYVLHTNKLDTSLSIKFNMGRSPNDARFSEITKRYIKDTKWEIPRTQLSIEKIIGEGEFGKVLKASIKNIESGEEHVTFVAVKTLKDNAGENELKDLLSEFKLLQDVDHPNIIKLLGICSDSAGPIYVIMEYADNGSLREYLRKNRHVTMEPECLLDLATEAKSDSLRTRIQQTLSEDMLNFVMQICKGMEYLSEIKLVHRDLAARNVLLTSNKICKISDFGLTRDIYTESAYFKKSKGRVPVKWMAPESLADHIYNSKSDVWSFGIVIWEIITMGSSPYPGIAPENLFRLLRQGYRMERPESCPPVLYNIMKQCWNMNSEMRPTFRSLSYKLEQIVNDDGNITDGANAIYKNLLSFTDLNKSNDGNSTNIFESENQNNDLATDSTRATFLCYGNFNIVPHPYENDSNKSTGRITPTNECPEYYLNMASNA